MTTTIHDMIAVQARALDDVRAEWRQSSTGDIAALERAVESIMVSVINLAGCMVSMDRHYTARQPMLGGPLTEPATAGCDDPSLVGRGECDWGQGSHEQSFAGGGPYFRSQGRHVYRADLIARFCTIPQQKDEVAFAWANQIANALNMDQLRRERGVKLPDLVLLAPAEREFLRWAVCCHFEAPDSEPPSIPNDEAADDLLRRLGRPEGGDVFENEAMRAERNKREGDVR